jgi:hypothetical protein
MQSWDFGIALLVGIPGLQSLFTISMFVLLIHLSTLLCSISFILYVHNFQGTISARYSGGSMWRAIAPQGLGTFVLLLSMQIQFVLNFESRRFTNVRSMLKNVTYC